MKEVSEQEIVSYFTTRGNRFRNKEGMEFGMGQLDGIWTEFNLCNYNHGPLAIDISTEGDRPEEFISGFQLASPEEIDELGYNNSWMRYLNGAALIRVTPFELEATLTFRVVKRKTTIFSLDLHFYDEVYEHLTLPEDFERYISRYDRRLQAAADNRFKVNRLNRSD
jgi:hypothetical protein